MAVPVQTRPVTAQQWERALQRALEAGVDILTEPLSGQTFCESTRHPGVLYVVTRDSCSCVAGAHGQPCLHRAALLAQQGELALPAPAACFWCDGHGTVEDVLNQCYQPCPDCHGTGIRPDHRLAGLPAAPMVAAAA